MASWDQDPIVSPGARASVPAAGSRPWDADPIVQPAQAAPAPVEARPGPTLGATPDAARTGIMQGLTAGFGDEILAGAMTPIEMGIDAFQGKPFDIGRSFNQALERNRGTDRAAEAGDPNAYLAGNIAGAVGGGLGLAKQGVTLMRGAAPTVRSIAPRAAAEGAIYGAAHGAGAGEGLEDKLTQAASGAAFGALTGGAVGGVTGKMASASARKAVPTVEQLKSQASALYDAAEASGVTFSRPAVKQMADDVTAQVISEGIDPTLHPRATAALKRLQEAGTKGLTVKEAQTLRRVLSSAGKDFNNPDEARIAGMMVDKLDDFLAASVPELAQARAIYHTAKKGELIEKAYELAGSRAGQFSGSGFENALRTEFRALDRQIIKGQLKGLTDAEKEAIKKVANGGSLENIARWVGKLAPTGVVSMGMGGGVPFLIGNAFGGPAVGAAAAAGSMGAGFVGRNIATSLGKGNFNNASMLIRSGGKMPKVSDSNQLLADALVAGTGSQSRKVPKASSAVIEELMSMSR